MYAGQILLFSISYLFKRYVLYV